MRLTLSRFNGDKNAASRRNDPIFSEQFLDTIVLLGISIKIADTFYCELSGDRACFIKISIARISGKLDEKAGASRRVDGAIFLYRGTIVNELSNRKEVFTIENPPLRKFVSRIYDLYQRAENPIMFRRKL